MVLLAPSSADPSPSGEGAPEGRQSGGRRANRPPAVDDSAGAARFERAVSTLTSIGNRSLPLARHHSVAPHPPPYGGTFSPRRRVG